MWGQRGQFRIMTSDRPFLLRISHTIPLILIPEPTPRSVPLDLLAPYTLTGIVMSPKPVGEVGVIRSGPSSIGRNCGQLLRHQKGEQSMARIFPGAQTQSSEFPIRR